MKLIIHRGTHEIGGSCVEVKTANTRIILDIGMPLFSKHDPRKKFDKKSLEGKTPNELLKEGILPNVEGLYDGIESANKIDTLILSHPHQDHYGLCEYIKPEIPVYLSEEAKRIIEVSEIFVLNKLNLIKNPKIVEIGKNYEVGDMKIKPYLMDHSAFGALGISVKGDNQNLFYSGDFRAHGRKHGAFEWFIKNPPHGVDCLLLEGTMFGRSEKLYATEDDVEKRIVELIRESNNIVFGWFSAQNIDRLVSFFRAAKQTQRFFVIDLYAAYLLKKLEGLRSARKIPMPDWDLVRVFKPKNLMRKLLVRGHSEIVSMFRDREIRADEISKRKSEIVMMFRDSMWAELREKIPLDGSTMIYSQYEGYLKEGKSLIAHKEMGEIGMRTETVHTSGHAYVEDLQKYCQALRPKILVPIHTAHAGEYKETFKKFYVKQLEDGEELAIEDLLKMERKNIKISSFLLPEMIWLDVPDEPIEVIGKRFAEMTVPFLKCTPEQRDEIIKRIYDGVVGMQELNPCGIGQGIQILETGRFEGKWLEQLYILGIGVSKKGICWRFSGQPTETRITLDEKPVHIIVYEIGDVNLLSLDNTPVNFLIFKFTRLLKDKNVRETLLACNTPEEVIELFRREEQY